MMKKDQFIDTAKRIATDIPTRYQLGGWGQQDNGVYLFDCVCLIKSILWGFDFEKGGHGGAVYCSNGVPDLGANAFFEQCCYDISDNMSITEPGELVWLDGHIAIYIGNLRDAEATSDGDDKVQITTMDYDGRRFVNGYQVLRWQKHGKCKFIDYSKPTYKYKVGQQVILNGYYHKSNETNSECLGELYNQITKIVEIKDGEYPYHLENLGWCREKYLSAYTGKDYETLYKQEALKTKDLEKQVDQLKKEKENLQTKIDKAIKNLK